MSLSFATNETRVPALVQRLSHSAVAYENFVMRLASHVTHDDPALSVTRYNGGSWCLEQLDWAECGTVFWWRLESDARFYLSIPNSGVGGLVDAELLSMVACLMATSDLCCGFYNRAMQAENLPGASKEEIAQLSQLSEAYHDIHHGLRGYFLERLAADEGRCELLLRLID